MGDRQVKRVATRLAKEAGWSAGCGPADSVVAAAKLVPCTQLEHQNNFQHELMSQKAEVLKDLHAPKSRSYSYSPAESSQYSCRRQQAYILKVEVDGWKLEEEIQKKEALGEELRKTMEEFRRIQREAACQEVPYMQPASTVEHGSLRQCSFCGYKFLCTRLEKPMSICSKRQGSRRKVFDSRKARARGTELEQYQQSLEWSQNKPPRRNDWRQKHEIFIQTLHQTCQMQQVLLKRGKVSDLPPLPPIENPDYVTSPYCSHRFAP